MKYRKIFVDIPTLLEATRRPGENFRPSFVLFEQKYRSTNFTIIITRSVSSEEERCPKICWLILQSSSSVPFERGKKDVWKIFIVRPYNLHHPFCLSEKKNVKFLINKIFNPEYLFRLYEKKSWPKKFI